MNDDIKKLGQLFKDKRKEMNLSLKEVENSTSIRSSYLQAIEDGKGEQFLSSVYILGFIRQYATFLGLNADQIMKDHPELLQMPCEKHDFSYGIGTLEVRHGLGGGVKWFPNIAWLLVGGGILVLAWYLARYLGVL